MISFLEKKQKSIKESVESFQVSDALFKWALRRSLTLRIVNAQSCCTGHLKDLKVGQPNQISGVITQNPGRANVLILCGAVTHRMGPIIRHLYDQMEKPSWVVALGSCAAGGGAMRYSYAVARDLNKIVPVDVFVPGCPVSRESLIDALDKIVQKAS